ncbi:molybdenum cofactor biosynthesis protein E [Abyssogena phaseoliformis symbiont OG214]|uniref:molybdopterin synthase catalytic subunit MoaE n=1 Tax=Abyssogena phaseoliformis symbiont TaxID=596095 RepID=UPI00191690C6|nr:molybdopterin synthase catalytic subunit MoaE [Abyssogena phaseoliformis symbiont]MBW5288966.1 Molybdenum cofactor biosynthesis protein MoaE [Candidatus Ruthia sp. Apha_13_S6]BBB22825.1 molybdenum cofactor biosynthesis protein E [Abyssogena phaseoliformis symbiont OG214]
MDKIIIQQQDFDLSTEIALVKKNDSDIGAVVSFVGFVRDLDDATIQKMTLEHYPGMTEKALKSIVNQAKKRWSIGNIALIHRVGDLNINDQIVLVITSSKHRQSAFESCEFIMDYLKTQAPFWKKEHTQNKSKWVEAKNSDKSQKNRWE